MCELRAWHGMGRGTAWARQGNGMGTEGERQGNGMGTTGKRHGHGRETAWARHAICESALTLFITAVGTAWSLIGCPLRV